MQNQWADPAGYPKDSKPIRYRIRRHNGKPHNAVVDLFKWREPIEVEIYDELVEHQTELTYDFTTMAYHHSLAAIDQVLANMITQLIQRACQYFVDDDDEYEALDYVDDIRLSSAEIEERIKRINKGENIREANRINKEWYDLEQLPWGQQRALIEQIEDVKRKFGFEFIGEAE